MTQDLNAKLDRQPKWRIILQLWWQWLRGGPTLVRMLGSQVLAAVRAQEAAERGARDTRREVFKSWSLVTAASDGTVIRIRPETFTIHIQGSMNSAVKARLAQAWKESALLIRFPFPIADGAVGTFPPNGDWKLAETEPALSLFITQEKN